MRILAGGPARKTEGRLFRAHLAGLEAQTGHFELEIRHEVAPDPGGPRWQHDKIERVAKVRQEFLEWGECRYYDPVGHPEDPALFMVDTDVILGPGVLERLLEVDAPVVYGVFWTRCNWGGSHDDWPQVWDINPYGWTQETADALRADGVNEVPVYGGGACTLIRGRGFESRYWPLLESLKPRNDMFAGEDRTYCLGLECRGIPQVAVTGLPIRHAYNMADKTKPAIERAVGEVGLG